MSERHANLLAEGTFSVKEAARFAGLAKSTLYLAMDDGRLLYCKIGRRRLIPRRALLAFLAAGLSVSGDGFVHREED